MPADFPLPTPQTSPAVGQLSFAKDPLRSAGDQHTLIFVFLRGGADTLNLWVPFADDNYYRLRPSLAIKPPGTHRDSAIQLTEHYALHPAMRSLEGAFKEGRLGAVQSVGTDNSSGSHFECQDQMEHGDSAEGRPAGGGWLGRFLRTRVGSQSPLPAVAIGTALPESLRGAPSVSVMERLSDIALHAPSGGSDVVMDALRSLYRMDATLLGEHGTDTLRLFQRIADLQAKANGPENGALYPREPFGEGLREVAQLIKARIGLEVACVDLGGWDTHFFQGTANGTQADRIRLLSEGLAAMDKDLLSFRGNYTVMVTTEFGRRMYENASLGTDHGRGFMLMALGDRVQGGRVTGPWPIRAIDEDNPLGPAGVEPMTDFRMVFREILQGTHGLAPEAASIVFPDTPTGGPDLMKVVS